MKVYCYPEPSMWLVRYFQRHRAGWLGVVVCVTVWACALPVVWVLIALGDLGHAVAGWCGFDSRDWGN